MATVASSTADTPIDIMVKRHEGVIYVFAVAMREEPTEGSFTVTGLPAEASVQVLGEDRTIRAEDGSFSDDFEGYAVHLYKIDTTMD